MALETRIYQKENNAHFFKHLKESLKDIYTSRFLAKQLAVRDINAQYRFYSFPENRWAMGYRGNKSQWHTS